MSAPASTPQTMAEKNKSFFDTFAPKYGAEDWHKAISRQFTDELRRRWDAGWYAISPTSSPLRMLDFACGPGMSSFAFHDHVSAVRGLDISSGMADEYNKRVAELGIPREKMHAVAADLLAAVPASQPQISGEEWFGFDLAVISFALHHLEDPKLAVERIVERLRPGGVFVVLDWTNEPAMKDGVPVLPEHGRHHGHGHGKGHGNGGGDGAGAVIAHQGFNKEDLEPMFQAAGCDEFDYDLTKEPFMFGGERAGQVRKGFVARGRKAL